jgi:4'-phosphopantetheinyl transferase
MLDRAPPNVKHAGMHQLVATDFSPYPLATQLGEQEIHLWFFPHWTSTPNTAESPHLRVLLGRYLNCGADDVRIDRDEHGKPRITDSPLHFNLSHCGEMLLLGVAARQSVGIDLEQPRRDRPFLRLAERFFDPAEASALAALPQNLQETAFLRLWSGKEAVLKAHGRGIAFGLSKVAFELDLRGELHRLTRMEGESASDWHVVRLTPAEGVCGALAWKGPERLIRACRATIQPD